MICNRIQSLYSKYIFRFNRCFLSDYNNEWKRQWASPLQQKCQKWSGKHSVSTDLDNLKLLDSLIWPPEAQENKSFANASIGR